MSLALEERLLQHARLLHQLKGADVGRSSPDLVQPPGRVRGLTLGQIVLDLIDDPGVTAGKVVQEFAKQRLVATQ